MVSLTLEEINQLMADGGYDVVFDSAVFLMTNASNEAVYDVSVNGIDVPEHVYIREYEGIYRISYNPLSTETPAWDSHIEHPEEILPAKEYSVENAKEVVS